MSGVDYLIERGIADPERLGVLGWSYGGFLTASVITQTSRFKAASVGAGMIDLVPFAGTTDMRDFVPGYLGRFWDTPDLWRSRSPIDKIERVTTPTLIQHGEADARVPVSQGYELYFALKTLGVPTRMVVYPRQGHIVAEPKLQIHLMQDNLDWFSRWLKQ
jgi:dipeptidyl aminopeptidase/acylaminoacyl peptidase